MLSLPLCLIALVPLDPSVHRAQVDSGFVLPAVRATQAPVIDGALADGEWDGASLARNFLQYQPQLGDPSPQRSEVLVLYDSTHLFVAFRLFDTGAPTAQLTRRDAELLDDDAVVLLLDSNDENRSGYFFMTNPFIKD